MTRPPDRPVENGERNIDLPLTWDDIDRWIAVNQLMLLEAEAALAAGRVEFLDEVLDQAARDD